MNNDVTDILKKNELSVTDGRKKVLELFMASPGALTHADIEKKAGHRLDRVTIYRTLQIFLGKGLIHSIPSSDDSIRYALCRNECDIHGHHDDHVHFICDHCGKTTCLDDIHVPAVKLPAGYSSKEVNVIVSGLCEDCN
jgi:Fur family ferric uptake transcriptional regulator